MMRIYKFLVAEGFKIKKYTPSTIEAVHKKAKYCGRKTELHITIFSDYGAMYRTTWENDKEEYRIDAHRQQFIFEELKKYGFVRSGDE